VITNNHGLLYIASRDFYVYEYNIATRVITQKIKIDGLDDLEASDGQMWHAASFLASKGMALDPATNWKTYMKVSKKPSDHFPSALKKTLTNADYKAANAKLRGVAGELMFIIEDVELPGGLKIVARQVDAAGKVIDFGLVDASGARALLEVKTWSAKTWARELAAASADRPKKMFLNMVAQLSAAKSTGQPVYLAVSNALGSDVKLLTGLLARHRIRGVTVVTVPEAKLTEISRTLRKGLAVAGAGSVLVAADQLDVDDVDD
jgi:hypothetical protein